MFVVGARREMDAAAIAINEQRFASNMKNVVTVEEFGTVAEGNVAEVLKFLPGLTIDYGAGDASTVSIGGVPAEYVPVTVGGFSLATAASSGTSRVVQFEQFSINNIARLEVLHSPTPESVGSALAGSINMVTRSAFERSRPLFNYSAYFMMRDDERSLRKTPGPFGESTYKIHPGFDFNYIRPVNARFGFTLSGGHNSQYSLQPLIRQTWAGAGAATNGNALPDTTPGSPYLTQVTVRDGGKIVTRSNIGTTIDYQLGRNDRVSLSFLFAEFENDFRNKNFNFSVGRVLPGQFSTTHTQGAPGAGQIQLNQGANRKHTTSYMPTLTYRHEGPIWKGDVGLGYSRAENAWDLWLGTAPERPFAPGIYHPKKWRAWQDFGTGWSGDIGCHVFDAVWKGLALTAPTSVVAKVQESWEESASRRADTWPQSDHITWVFPGSRMTEGTALTIEWFDGEMYPPAEVREMTGLAKYPEESAMVVGTEGTLLLQHGAGPLLFPREKFEQVTRPKFSPRNHYHHFVDACLGGESTESHFGQAAPMTESILLGTVAIRVPGCVLHWDAPRMQFSNSPEANRLLQRTYRKGWQVAGL